MCRREIMKVRFSENVFDYRALRLLIGLIAFSLPFIVSIIASSHLSSISASYHTNARDIFIGMLFIVGSFLWAYNGHSAKEAWASKFASLATIMVALFPTSCDTCDSDIKSYIHYIAAVVLFSILAYFCFVPFRKNTKGKGEKKGRRSKIYLTCGWIMAGCMVTLGALNIILPDEMLKKLSLTYWAEVIALAAFGVAWIVAGKYFRPLVDEDEALHFFK